MSQSSGRKFPLFVHVYTWLALLVLSLLPLALALLARAANGPLSGEAWALVIGSIVLSQALFRYVQHRCSSTGLPYWDGLLYIAWTMNTGWAYFSIFFVIPALAVALVVSLSFALVGDIMRNESLAPASFRKLLDFFYRIRLVQQ